jgi:hypothetical protein
VTATLRINVKSSAETTSFVFFARGVLVRLEALRFDGAATDFCSWTDVGNHHFTASKKRASRLIGYIDAADNPRRPTISAIASSRGAAPALSGVPKTPWILKTHVWILKTHVLLLITHVANEHSARKVDTENPRLDTENPRFASENPRSNFRSKSTEFHIEVLAAPLITHALPLITHKLLLKAHVSLLITRGGHVR